MSVDNGRSAADLAAMAAIVDALTEELGTRPRKAVSDALGLHASQAGRILDGSRPLYPHEIATIEQAWQLPLGTILRRAGLVRDAGSVRDTLAADTSISPTHRQSLLDFYDSLASKPSMTARKARKTPRS